MEWNEIPHTHFQKHSTREMFMESEPKFVDYAPAMNLQEVVFWAEYPQKYRTTMLSSVDALSVNGKNKEV